MPVVNFHLVTGFATPGQEAELLSSAAALYCAVLQAPRDRVRAMITAHSPRQFLVADGLVAENDVHAPVFEFLVLEGRPLEQRLALFAGFTELIVRVLGVEHSLVRGRCIQLDPQDWSIGGQPASLLRAEELRERAASAESGSAD